MKPVILESFYIVSNYEGDEDCNGMEGLIDFVLVWFLIDFFHFREKFHLPSKKGRGSP